MSAPETEMRKRECRVGGPLHIAHALDQSEPPRALWPRCSGSDCAHWRFLMRSTTQGHCGLAHKPD